ncbi:GTP pyrophosphokinase [Entomoplasma freundtii]|uniref:Penta-phosphate guanosine-3'-pyrophosphohydrolase n=1 Tax=Entomoplasma freundtii TaxID=74700 RepID=A0A2K8NRA0_9MOLU|nr:RelA/SpoT family protein [Entomoplasma freundtii]ATZ16375.1 GTP diphosphokinase [Entomoplasma freundtii]TDY56586.1 GTP pyrophosphokinase [Entomoplasma freundtii]
MAGIPKFKLHSKNDKTRKRLIPQQIEEFHQLEEELKTYIFAKKELKEIRVAYDYAAQKHQEQKRKNGDPYIYHPLSTAYFLAQLQMGPQTIIAGLLHDILEDTPVTAIELEKEFGTEVANLVEAVTKVSYFAKENREAQKSEYLRKIYLSMAKDIRVIIIKLSDRLHNMLTIHNLGLPKQRIIAKETLEIYSSIAHRIGMKEIKNILEDLSFEVLNPEEYQKIQKLLQKDASQRQAIINQIMDEITIYLRKEKHLKVIDIFGRPKGTYSIYRKMNHFGRSFDDLKDLLAIRIIARSNDDCYKILGFLHQKYTPLANKFKDYIATPKNGVYQSLHTTLADTQGNIFEVQIRTIEMDNVAETGMAAHWAYKEGEVIDIKRRQLEIDEQIDLFRRIIELDKQRVNDGSGLEDEEENETIEKVLKEDFFTTMIYVLTPDKKVITLPYGSTVLDFAYRIHSEIGQATIGAKIDGVFVPINTILKSGQIVEVKTSPKQEPTYEQLKIVTTANARNRIRKYLATKLKEDDIKDKKTESRQIVDKVKNNINSYINKNDLRWRRKSDEQIFNDVKKLGYSSLDEFYLAINRGDYTIPEVVELAFVDFNASKDEIVLVNIDNKKEVEVDSKNEVIVSGIANLKASLASCCRPVPGEQIIGFVSKSSGIKIHLRDCINVNLDETKERLVEANWNKKVADGKSYMTNIKYYATDRPNLLYDVSKVLTSLKATTMNATLRVDEKTLLATGVLKIKIKDADQLHTIISSLKSIPSIIDVKRVMDKL